MIISKRLPTPINDWMIDVDDARDGVLTVRAYMLLNSRKVAPFGFAQDKEYKISGSKDCTFWRAFQDTAKRIKTYEEMSKDPGIKI